MSMSTSDILEQIGQPAIASGDFFSNQAREVYNNTSSEQSAREVYKKKKRKKEKNASKVLAEFPSCEDRDDYKVSKETCSLASYEPSSQCFASDSLLGNTAVSQLSQEEGVSNIPASENLLLAGVIAQHAITARGIKISLTLQSPADAELAEMVNLTAELKRRSRLRELGPYDSDSEEFARKYNFILDQIRDSQDESYAVGRIHDRGKRSQWYSNMAVVAALDTNTDHVVEVTLFLNNEEYYISMRDILSPRQQGKYNSSGTWGKIVMQRTQAPTFATAPRTSLYGNK